MHMLFDKLTLDGTRLTADGYLAADARVARTGIQIYTGREVDPENKHGLRDKAEVRVFRPETEVFARDALMTYAHRPITNDHPSTAVDANNWKQHAVGMTGGEVVRDGEFVRVPLVLMDAAAIDAVRSGKRQLSMGYSAVLKFDAGVTPDGEKYDAVQTQLKMNHLAICRVARGGPDLSIGDQKEERLSMTTRAIIVDGLPVDLADRDAAIVTRYIDRTTKLLSDTEKALADAVAKHTADMSAKDKELAAKDAKIAELEKKILSDADLDKRVAERAALVSKVKSLAPSLAVDGKSDADIRAEVVRSLCGDAAVEGKSADYIQARFDMLSDADPVRTALASSTSPAPRGVADAATEHAAFAKSVASLNAWRDAKAS